MSAIEIKAMKPEHVDEVMVVEKLSFTIPWSKNAFVEELTGNKFAAYIVAQVNGRVVGYAGMWKVLDEGHITNIAVHPAYRGKHIGRLLLENLMGMARESGISSMTLEVRRGNVVAQNLYTSCGFTTAGFRRGYYSDNGEDALIMWNNSIQ